MSDFRMPSLGADMDKGKVVEWLKKPGDRIARGDVVAVVETQKGAFEIEVFEEGVLSEILVAVGIEAPVGAVLARIDGVGAAPLAAAPPLVRAAWAAGTSGATPDANPGAANSACTSSRRAPAHLAGGGAARPRAGCRRSRVARQRPAGSDCRGRRRSRGEEAGGSRAAPRL